MDTKLLLTSAGDTDRQRQNHHTVLYCTYAGSIAGEGARGLEWIQIRPQGTLEGVGCHCELGGGEGARVAKLLYRSLCDRNLNDDIEIN